MILFTQKSFIFNTTFFSATTNTSLFANRKIGTILRSKNKKRDNNDEDYGSAGASTTQKRSIFPMTISSSLLTEAAIAVFGLGFIDAGYSGDWSRIGVISKEIEELLKLGAFVVVPFCMFLILSISKKHDS